MNGDTKHRILDAAERLFSLQGFEATSLRTIIGEAKVNLAAIHYHFHSKEALIDAVLLRRLEPLNRERLEMLDLCVENASLEAVLRAFVAPPMRMGNQSFVRLMGRVITEDEQRLPRVIQQHFGTILQRFTTALRKAAPELAEQDLFWRMHFTIGAMAHTLRAGQDVGLICGNEGNRLDGEALIEKLVAFAAAGFRAGVKHA